MAGDGRNNSTVDRLAGENLALQAKLEEAEIELQARRVYDAGPREN